ncbi:MAG: hypothetical protein IPF72_10330 [Chitinophagaceae bacterium]|nr:hypothetical protein [Chitinophagaceae bacterium]
MILNPTNLLREFGKLYLKAYNQLTSDPEKILLEEFVIKMIMNAENHGVLDFLNGNYQIILQSLPSGKTMKEKLDLMEMYCKKLNWFIGLNLNIQRKILLTFGDYAYPLSD